MCVYHNAYSSKQVVNPLETTWSCKRLFNDNNLENFQTKHLRNGLENGKVMLVESVFNQFITFYDTVIH